MVLLIVSSRPIFAPPYLQIQYSYLDVTVWDFCSTTADDFIGEVLIKLAEANLTDESNLYELGELTYEERIQELAEMTSEGQLLGSGPDSGRSPVEWGDFPSIHLFVRSPPQGPKRQPGSP